MIRSIHTQSLRDAFLEVAVNNNGFLYVDNRELRKQIQEKYKEKNEVQNSFMVSPKVSADHIRSELEDFATGDDRVHKREKTEGYYFNLEKFPDWEENIVQTFVRTFDSDTPIVREKDIKPQVRSDTNIADDDVVFLLTQFTKDSSDDSTYLESLDAQGTTFYLPGAKLYENSSQRLADVRKALSIEADRERNPGTVTRQAIEQALEVEAPDELIRELVRRDYLIDLRASERWLVNEQDCISQFTQSTVSETIAPRIKQKLSEHDFVVPTSTFSQIVEETYQDATGILNDLDEESRERVLESLESSVQEELADSQAEEEFYEAKLTEDTPNSNDEEIVDSSVKQSYLVWDAKVPGEIQREASRLNEIKGDSDTRHFVENQLKEEIRSFGNNDPVVNGWYRDHVKEELKELAKQKQ